MKNPVMILSDQKKAIKYTLWRIDDEIHAKLYSMFQVLIFSSINCQFVVVEALGDHVWPKFKA